MKVPFCDFIQNMSQAPSMPISMWIKMNKWNYLKNPSQEFKKSYEYLKRLEGKIKKGLFFYVKIF